MTFDPKKPYKARGSDIIEAEIIDSITNNFIVEYVVKYTGQENQFVDVVHMDGFYNTSTSKHDWDLINIEEPEEVELLKDDRQLSSEFDAALRLREDDSAKSIDYLCCVIRTLLNKIDEHSVKITELENK